ncbi:hypothetical protein P3875_02140 [Myroides sp. JBRI-B21084]|uniref:hypothetical protein n=1 Tax=Myroides sp. JBRI-B21084 TaxID=3119977 RepID=UPI0026E1660B|nr:hypothetical protein [Paenimyroides cloacae]WKW46876.1 hypothetical protein P3875_02140 [Paenimyroides cloacae]
MKKEELKKQLKKQSKLLSKQQAMLKQYEKLFGNFEKIAKRMKKNTSRFEMLLEDIEIDEELTDEELDAIMNEFKTSEADFEDFEDDDLNEEIDSKDK